MFDPSTDPSNPRLQLLNKQRAANSPNKSQSEDHKATSSRSLTNARRLQCIIYLYTPRVAFAAVTRRKKSLSLSHSTMAELSQRIIHIPRDAPTTKLHRERAKAQLSGYCARSQRHVFARGACVCVLLFSG